jgi:DNA-directed RNA polymerase subunit RPC12/RpoP
MPTEYRKCAECGREGDAVEFVSRRVAPRNSEERPGQAFDTVYLCAGCAEKHGEQEEAGPAKHCQQCGGPINAGEEQQRFKTVRSGGGALAWHYSVDMVLCPQCAAAYDGTSNFLIGALLLFILTAIVLGCGSILLR